MPRNSSGTYTRPSNSFSQPVLGTLIDPTSADGLFDDYDAALTDSLSRTGEGGMEAPLNMGGNAINNVAAPSSPTDAATKAYVDAASAAGVDDRAALKALDTNSVKAAILREAGREGIFVWLAGDYSAEVTLDTEEGIYIASTGTPSSSGAWVRANRSPILPGWFGIVNDGSADCSGALASMLAVAGGNEIYFPAGTYRLDSKVSVTVPVNIRGAGSGAGPGLVDSGQCTRFLCNFLNPSALEIETLYACTLRDFQVIEKEDNPTATSGIAINIIGAVGNQTKTLVENVAIDGFYQQLRFMRPAYPTIRSCYFQQWAYEALVMETDSTREGSGGFITNNYLFGFFFGSRPQADQRAAIALHCGYTIVSQNEILGGQYGVDVAIRDYDAGFVKIIDNTIENQQYIGVRLTMLDDHNASMWDVSGNEFSNVSRPDDYLASIYVDDTANRQWLDDLTICRNITRHTGSVGLGHIRVAAGRNVLVSENVLEQVSGTAAGGVIISGVSNSASLNGVPRAIHNQMRGAFTVRYEFHSAAPSILVDYEPMTVASIPVNCAVGSQIYASDGKATDWALLNLTLTGGGNGSLAYRRASEWLATSP